MEDQRILVIGYGNTLRGDDGAGYITSLIVEEWNLAGVRVLPARQLTPDLAQDMSHADCVILVDAFPASHDDASIEVRRLSGVRDTVAASAIGHAGHPEHLLEMARVLYAHDPEVWLVGIPARQFDLPNWLSNNTRTRMGEALAWIRDLIRARAETAGDRLHA